MALRPVDLQNIINTSVEVAKVTQTRNDTPNMHQGQFAIQLQKEAERKKEQIQKGQGHNAQETKIKEEGGRRRGQDHNFSGERKKRERKEEKESEVPQRIENRHRHIDIRI